MSRLTLSGIYLFAMGSLLNLLTIVGISFNSRLLDDGACAALFADTDPIVVDYGESLLRFLFILAVIACLLIVAAILCWIGAAIKKKSLKAKQETASQR
jgi:hypothetical protein